MKHFCLQTSPVWIILSEKEFYKMSKTSIRKIAAAVGVAPVTVYRALSGNSNVNPETRRRIIRCAGEFNYILPEHHCRNVAIVVPHFNFTGYPGKMLRQLEKSLHDASFRVQVIPEKDISVLGDHMYAGVISMVWNENEVLALPREFPLPVVSLNVTYSAMENISLVASDKNGVHFALEYLKKHGYGKIFFVGTLTGKNPQARERLGEFRNFCNENNMDFAGLHASVAASDIDSVIPLILKSGADAVFCASETFAFHVGKRLQNQGVKIPGDISLMGMEDEELNTAFDPPLTAIRQDFEKLAAVTVDILRQSIENQLAARNIRIPYALIERGSVRKSFSEQSDT